MRYTIFILLVFTGIITADAQRKPVFRYYPVMRVTDGDTFRAADGSAKGMIIRLIGVDAPELHSSRNKLKHEFGDEAAHYLEKLIGGKRVRFEYDVDRTDKYGRTLAYVYLEDGTFVNAKLIANGYANIMTIPPNVKYQELFLKLERRARRREAGLWGLE